jgi:hypothetical protein
MSAGKVYTRSDYEAVMALVAERRSYSQIEAAIGVPRSTISRMCRGQWQGKMTSKALLGRSALTSALRPYLDGGHDLDELTVLTEANDPFRQDTEAGHRDGAWLRDSMTRLGVEVGEEGRKVHMRGLHYMLIGQPVPDGTPYQNTYEQWCWLYGVAGKAARWLGYVPFGQITDQRNAEPVIRIAPPGPQPRIYVADPDDPDQVSIPDAEWFAPEAGISSYDGVQPFRLAIIGEKSSLEPVLGPVAGRYGADLYLPTGEISETQVHRMATVAAADGRPLVVFYFSDCDPAGWQMGISVARKLQAFRELLGEKLEFDVHRVALVPDQVRDLGLPSTPLKKTESRAAKWEQAMGTAQTEIDALAALQPDVLAGIARGAVGRFYDSTLQQRTMAAAGQWRQEAQQAVDEGLDGDREQIVLAATAKLDRARELVNEVCDSFETTADLGDLPEFEPPGPAVPVAGARAGTAGGTLLVSTGQDFPEQCRALKESKAYAGDEEVPE